ncbi:uncharacterized protein SPAPADRAFT_63820 [Spathaspora passalidarum NRRL Y-27907]|uniref:Thioester reductase (TE) domain-containing protein n=1 Tax=Spathaspora passalidarum (strain NRRL Y-27907 / 11-Y1) TaxID=619300 RepID=G3AVP1_SPAPN|nr:uncharacterized protein SPAPADRAFT_63820 [Spathaspora passalidarum NRRL Y-27907]EGW30206.1 hypothetical protein SPAPADRAFT_63820 [Spathaspora passalidarum NRRL Y-27907]
MSKAIAVFGGNGFLGHKICEIGVLRGYDVTSFSRSGDPPENVIHQPWIKKVQWERADIFSSKSYAERLGKFHNVVHSIGILFENQAYKKAMNSNFNFLNDIQQLANTVKGGNPMKRGEGNATYEAVQRDTAVLLADTFITEQKELPRNYVYISADSKPPIVPAGYLNTKREAEFELGLKEGIRGIFMRPGIMYDETHEGPMTTRDFLLRGLRIGVAAKEMVLGEKFCNEIIKPVVSTEQVAHAIYDKLEQPDFKGVVTLDDIKNTKLNY